MTQEDILDQYPDDTFLFADGLDDAIIGVDGETILIPGGHTWARRPRSGAMTCFKDYFEKV